MKRFHRLLLLLSAVPGAAYSQTMTREWRDRTQAFVAETKYFVFHSDSLMNLHDFLMWRAISTSPVEPRTTCLDSLDTSARAGWQRAEQFYSANLTGKGPRTDSVYRDVPVALRFRLAGFPNVQIVPDSLLVPVVDLLHNALPAYRACWWPDHDRRNRVWIAALVGRLRLHEDTLRARLSRLWQAPWGGKIPVDVAGYANFGGANTVVDPDHILISSANSGYRDDSALEMIFHEASHTVVGSGADVITRALRDTSVTHGRRVPKDFSHVVLFYTVGRVTQRMLLEDGVLDHEPYVYREGLFRRAWPTFQRPVELYWQPYLDGRIDPKTAIRNVLDAMR